MIHESIAVYRGESIRAENGSQTGMPVFGRFAAIVRGDSYRLIEEDGCWRVGLPHGSALYSGDCNEADCREAWAKVCEALGVGRNSDGWTVDEDEAKREAIADAAKRHNAKVAESRGYAKAYGGAVVVRQVTIRNTNGAYGDAIEFTADTLEHAVRDMQNAIRECGPDFAGVVVTDDDYEVVESE